MPDNFDTLYAYRHVQNADKIIEWAHSQGILTTLEVWDIHVTLVYSKSPVAWNYDDRDCETLLVRGGKRTVEKFGEEGDVLVLQIESQELQDRHAELIAMGATSDFDQYRPHITITHKGEGVDVSQIMPYDSDIQLGPEWFQPIGGNPYGKNDPMTNHSQQENGFQSYGTAQVVKVNKRLGLVFGYAVVCKIAGEDYFDHHGDHIPEDAMLKASAGFMKSERVSGDMHGRDVNGQPVTDGQVVFAFPMTQEIADSLGIIVEKTGLLVAMQPSPEVLLKFESGEYTGFSIGGRRIQDEEVK